MSSTGFATPRHITLFGVTGQLGQEVLELLDDEDALAIGDVSGVASPDSAGRTFAFGDIERDVEIDWPALKGCDLVLVCTRGDAALEIARECLKAQVPCVDLTGAFAQQAEVADALRGGGRGGRSGRELGRHRLRARRGAAGRRAVGDGAGVVGARGGAGAGPTAADAGTVVSSAAALGRAGVVSLSEESIALFNQSAGPDPGPAGQAVAFDVLPGGGRDEERVRAELARALGADLGLDVAALQVPTFVGEGASITVELAEPLERADLEARLDAAPGLERVEDGLGSRGLAAVEAGAPDPVGPTLRDAAGLDGVLVGRIAPDRSLEDGRGWRLWLSCDPLRLVAAHAVRIARIRLAGS